MQSDINHIIRNPRTLRVCRELPPVAPGPSQDVRERPVGLRAVADIQSLIRQGKALQAALVDANRAEGGGIDTPLADAFFDVGKALTKLQLRRRELIGGAK